MKKIFSLLAATLFSAALMAEVETNPASTNSNDTIVGVSYSILGTYNAGSGNKCGSMSEGGVKFRANRNGNILPFVVNDGYKITGLILVGNTNSNNQANVLDSITVDGVHYIGYDNSTIPAKNASFSDTIVLNNIEAISNITLHFASPNASQINLQYAVTYEARVLPTDVATLRDITVAGQTIEGFRADSLNYSYELPYGSTVVPVVTATPTLSNEQVNITPASAVPGATTIVATSADGTVSTTYTVNFTVSSTQSTDATLKSLKVAGTTISGFRADSIIYSYDVAYVDTVIPQVTAEVNDTTARLLIVQAPSVPGLASVTVTAQAGNTLTYSVLFVRLAAEKQIKELMYDNWYYAYQPAGNDTVFAHYIAGTEVPLIDHYVLSEGASLAVNLENSTFTVTGMDQTTAEYPYVLSPVTPFAAGNDTIWFDGSENYVICPYGFDSSKGGYKFSKTDSDYSREWNGKTHVDIFLTEADSIYLIGGVSDRKVKIRVNDVVTKTGNLGKDKNLWVPVHRSAPFCLSVISNQTGGDGSVKGIVVAHMQGGATACHNLSEQTNVRKFILNGQLVIERDGIRYNAAGQRL